MADAALEGLVEKIQHLLRYNAELITDAKTEMEKLLIDLRLLGAFLVEQTSGKRDRRLQQELVSQTQNVIYEAEDVVDIFISEVFNNSSKSMFLLRSSNRRQALLNFSTQVENISAKLTHILSTGRRFIMEEHDDEEIDQVSAPRENRVVGFEDEMEKLIGYLTERTEQLDVISITGMPGIGKTTLARKIFMYPDVQYEFTTRIWISVGNNLTVKDICLAILRQLTNDSFGEIGDNELARAVRNYLEEGKFLIVMDDVRSANDWGRLEIVLPKSNYLGKVLITTRNEEVGRRANVLRLPHRLRSLNGEESFKLLELEVFGKVGECPVELQMIGNLIARQCNGLPLAIVVMGSILSTKVARTERAWSKASKQVVPTFHYQNFYDDLPSHLKVCFLYLAMFPLDFEIPAWKLIHMWIAEGFIRRSRDGVTLEETGEHYLEDLISRNLVRAERVRFDGKVKTCRVHDMLHEFCRIQAGKENENVLKEIKFTDDGVFQPPISELPSYRRLCIHSDVFRFLSSEPSVPHVRSVVSFSETFDFPTNHSALPITFKLVRVLEFMPIRFSKIPNGIYQLVHLRYLTLSSTLAVLPTGFSKLINLETLVVVTTSRTLEIKADIWKLPQFRHFKTNASANLPKASKTKDGGGNLQTLGMISPQSCTVEVFDMVRNLKNLGIRGKLSILFDGKIGSFDSLGRLISLEKLKLINDVFPMPASKGIMDRLPPAYRFPPRLRSLTLASTYLDWSQMSILG